MYQRSLPALLLAMALAGCGGGGGGEAGPGLAPSSSNAGLQLTVPSPTYGALTEELQAFNTLNEIRRRCGHTHRT
jgi:hypothetical protein